MATVTGKQYGLFQKSLWEKRIDMAADTMKLMLVTSTYTPDQDAHQFKSDVTGEVTGTNYTAGGLALSSGSVAYNASTNTLTFDAADAAWSNATISNARHAILYDSTPGTDATRPLIAFFSFSENVSTTDGTLQLTWNSSGILTTTVA